MIHPGVWVLMAWQAGAVFALRSLQLWADPLRAAPRMLAHAAEKQRAMARGARGVTAAMAEGAAPHVVMQAAFEPARRRVAANARTMARKPR